MTLRPILSALVILATAGLAACGMMESMLGWEPTPPAPPWTVEFGHGHALAGRIWVPGEGRFIAPGELIDRLAAARFVMLGEKHDNPDHHRLQAWLIEELLDEGRRPAVALEMLTGAQAPALNDYLANHPGDAFGLGAAVGWARSGWPDYATYEPVFQAALDGGAPVLPANLPRATIQAIVKEGMGALGPERLRALGLNEAMPRAFNAAMRTEIIEGHCYKLPASMIDPMAAAQTARDAHMAGVLLRGSAAGDRDGAVLITGAGHARTDHGVPYHLRRRAPGTTVMSVGFVETEDLENDPTAYAARFAAERLPFDAVWFTAQAERDDPCGTFVERLRRAKGRERGNNAE